MRCLGSIHIPHAFRLPSNISFAAAKEASKIEDPQRRNEGVQRLQQWAQERGRPPSGETARKILDLRPVTQPSPQSQRIQALETENAQLRAEIGRLRDLVVSLGGSPDIVPPVPVPAAHEVPAN